MGAACSGMQSAFTGAEGNNPNSTLSVCAHNTSRVNTKDWACFGQVYDRFGLDPIPIPQPGLPSYAGLRQPSVWPLPQPLAHLLDHPLESAVGLEGSILEAVLAQTIAAALAG